VLELVLLVLFFYHACSVEIILEGSVEIILEGSVEIIFVCWYVVQSNLESEARSVTSIVINLEYLKNRDFRKSSILGLYRFWQISRFPGSGRFRGFPGRVPVPARSGPGPDPGPDPEISGFRGPDLAGFGVQIWPVSGSGIRGKSTHSATMVSVVSSSTDPDFGEDLQILAKSGLPARISRDPRDPEIWRFRALGDPGSGPRNLGFPGPGRDPGFLGFGQISQISGFRVPWGLKCRFWGF
jgi:hypothetical protein